MFRVCRYHHHHSQQAAYTPDWQRTKKVLDTVSPSCNITIRGANNAYPDHLRLDSNSPVPILQRLRLRSKTRLTLLPLS